MRCPIFRRTVWNNNEQVFRSWFNSSFVISIMFFAVVLGSFSVVVSSSEVCVMTSETDCTCSNNQTRAVQCLTKGLNSSCYSKTGNESYRLFCEVMSQFDCTTKYSVKWGCSDCLNAYTNWLVAVISKNQTCLADCNNASLPIPRLCNDVLAKCPYFSPGDNYGNGGPAFDCA